MARTITTVHTTTCPEVAGSTAIQARYVDLLAKPHHACLPGGLGLAPVYVVVRDEQVISHEYTESTIWPSGEDAPRCRVCRGVPHEMEE